MNKIRSKKGYSLVEAIIALAVVVVVSATALSISLSSLATKVRAVNRSYAQEFADNALECFKAADNYGEFENLVAYVEGAALDGEDGEYKYVFEKKNFVADIKVQFIEGRDTFEIKVRETNGLDIISFNYEKGDLS